MSEIIGRLTSRVHNLNGDISDNSHSIEGRISSPSGGGGSAVIQPLNANTNRTYVVPSGVDGYNPVVVNVPTPTFRTQEKATTQNGDVVPDIGFDGLSKVSVNVPERIPVLQDVTFDNNGTFTADEGYDGFGQVVVNVQGGTTPVIEPLSIDANGTYNAPVGVDGYDPIVVNVPIPTFRTQEKSVTQNGDVYPDSGFDGLSKVSVNVPSGGITKTTLWTNPNPSATFAAQDVTLSVDASNFDFIEIKVYPSTTVQSVERTFITAIEPQLYNRYCHYFGGRNNVSSGNSYIRGYYLVNDTTLHIEQGERTNATGTSNVASIPFAIVGWKI